MMVAVDALVFCQPRYPRPLETSQSLHCTKCKNQCSGNFRSSIHLQTPDNECRDDTERPVHHARDRRVSVSGVDGDLWIDARSSSAGISRPEVG